MLSTLISLYKLLGTGDFVKVLLIHIKKRSKKSVLTWKKNAFIRRM